MNASRRRLVWGVVIAVAVLVLGRWTANFATERLWESRVSEAAALVGTRFSLLEAALELVGLLITIAWFVGQFVWITRSVILQHGDLPRPIGQLSERSVYYAAVGLGLILGVAVGGGTGDWLQVLLLDAAGVTFAVRDPLLQIDLGVFAARLPFWELIYGRAVAMVVPALIGVLTVAIAGGAIKLVDPSEMGGSGASRHGGGRGRRLWIARPARWQIAMLLVMAALLVGWDLVLEPYRLAASRSATLGPSEFLLRTTVAQVTVLFAATAAVLTFLWGVRFRFIVAFSGWVGLGLALLGGAILVQSRSSETPLGMNELSLLRRTDSVAFGASLGPAGRSLDPDTALVPSLWDREVVTQLAGGDSIVAPDAWPGTVMVAGSVERVWFVIRAAPRGDLSLVAVADDRTGPTGGLTSLRGGDDAFSPGIVPFLTMSRHHAWPGAPEFDVAPAAAGVLLSSAPRRIALAWSLQTGSVLRADPTQRIAWRLSPIERLGAIAPFAAWSKPRVAVVDREVYWISDGYLTIERFPGSRTIPWGAGEVGYARPGFLGMVRARGGETRIYLRPDADSLATAWARIADPLIEPYAAVPLPIADQLGAPPLAAMIAAQVLQGSGWLGRPVARIGRQFYPTEDLPNAGTAADPHRIPFLSDDGVRVVGVVRVPDSAGKARYQSIDTVTAVPAPRELQQRWDKFPFFQQLRDSVRASGSEFLPGVIRFVVRGDTMMAYQPNYAIGPGSQSGVVLVNVALGPRLGSGRTWEEAWLNLRGVVGPAPVGTDVTARLEEAREWLDKADAALKRGDLLEFGRAFAYLRELLRPGTATQPPPTP